MALLGTAFTMEQDFYKGRLVDKFDLEVITPNEVDRSAVHNIIYQELCLGEIKSKFARSVFKYRRQNGWSRCRIYYIGLY